MTYYLKNGKSFRVTPKENLDLTEHLPGGNYIIKKDAHGNLYLEQIDSFDVSGKIYGDTVRQAERILQTFHSRPSTTGVMLAGEKGSGKTLLSKKICVLAEQQNIPTIVINAPWCGDEFNAFMQQIEQPCIVLFDEFEKVYDDDDQESVLTLLDGTFPSKKLFMLTCNDKWRIDRNMRNRPGRIFYMLNFIGLDSNFIAEYCRDNLQATEHIDHIVKIASLFNQFNFDMLKALVEELNRYGETPGQALEMLNIKAEFNDDVHHNVQLIVNGQAVPGSYYSTKQWYGNPLMVTELDISYRIPDSDNTPDGVWRNAEFKQEHLCNMDSASGVFVFVNSNGERVILTRDRSPPAFNYNTL
jgi:hypothetical protein